MKISPLKHLVKEAAIELGSLQKGKQRLVKTGMDCIDSHIGGLLKGDIILIPALSGHGKSEFLYRLRENLLSIEINPDAQDYVFLDNSLEMKVFNQYLRGLKRATGKSKRDLLFTEFEKDSEERKKAVDYYKSMMADDRIFINQDVTTAEQFYKGCKEFLDLHRNKKAVFISIDHILLISGGDKKQVLDDTIEYCNRLKLEYDNVYFIVLSQLNRSILNRIAEKNNMAAPNTGDIYGSEFMTQASSYVVILFNAFKVGINQYLKVFPERYEHLEKHFGDEDSKGNKVSFDTVGKIFMHVLKVREGEANYQDLFIEDMDMPKEELEKMRKDREVREEKFDIPVLDMAPISFNTPGIRNARGGDFEQDEEAPF